MTINSLFCAECVANLSTGKFATWLTLVIAVSLFCLWKSYHLLKRARLVEDMPTSKIRSASQGYIELIGVATRQGHPQLAPLSSTLCLWWRYTIEKYQSTGRSSRWSTVEKRASSRPFYLQDTTGICRVDPAGGDISTQHRQVWYGNTRRPIGIPKPAQLNSGFFSLNRAISFGSRYRYTEYLIMEGDPLYTLGHFTTDSTGQRTLSADQLAGDILRNWKTDFPALLTKFDHNSDGELDLKEWQLVRKAALGKAHEQQAVAAGEPPDHLLSQPEHSGLPFIVSSAEQTHLSRGFRRGALAYAVGFLLAGALATWLMTNRLIG
ncbi:MAG: hypothetical protein COB19_04015 [Porticoccus sp.]|nr:MAG: hypothetical protein COB19_04015 [Porticoccus sp.]